MKPRHVLATAGLLTMFLLGGCAGLWPEGAEPPRMVDFGPEADYGSEPPLQRPVRLARVHAPSWLEGNEIHYRDLSRQPHLLSSYGRHVWLAAPTELLGEEIDALLEARAADDRAGARLEIRLTRFEQVIEDQENAHVRARMTAVLERDGERRRQVFTEQRAVTPDISGAREGLPQAGRALVRQLGDWLAEEA